MAFPLPACVLLVCSPLGPNCFRMIRVLWMCSPVLHARVLHVRVHHARAHRIRAHRALCFAIGRCSLCVCCLGPFRIRAFRFWLLYALAHSNRDRARAADRFPTYFGYASACSMGFPSSFAPSSFLGFLFLPLFLPRVTPPSQPLSPSPLVLLLRSLAHALPSRSYFHTAGRGAQLFSVPAVWPIRW